MTLKKVRYAGVGYAFTVGNDNYTAGGDYNPQTGIIRIFRGAIIGDRVQKGLLAHEIQHARFQNVSKRSIADNNAIDARIRKEEEDRLTWRDSFLRADGTFRNPEQDEKLYPGYNVMIYLNSDFNGTDVHGKKLRKGQSLSDLDGVSPYSESYWKKFNTTKKYSDYYSAVNETLAEIRKIKVTNPSKKVHKKWTSLYDTINSIPLEK